MNKQAAYILFYVRKDVTEKQVAQLYPQIDSTYMFAGRPITTKEGRRGFVVKTDKDVHVQFYDDKSKSTSIVKIGDLAAETDSSLIKHNEQEMAVILKYSQIKCPQEEEKTEDAIVEVGTRCCNLFPSAPVSTKKKPIRKFDEPDNNKKDSAPVKDLGSSHPVS